MAGERPFALVRTTDQWCRVAHDGTAIDADSGGVQLSWELRPTATSPRPATAGGLAFDEACRLFHSVPGEGRVERLLWAGRDPVIPRPGDPPPEDLFEAVPEPVLGDFAPAGAPTAPLRVPMGLAVDRDDRLFVAEAGSRSVLVVDLWSGRVLQRHALPTGDAPRRTPVDLAAAGSTVWVLADRPASLLRMTARSGPVAAPLPTLPAGLPASARPVRIAVAPAGELVVLYRDTDDVGWVVAPDVAEALRVPDATDIEFDGHGRLVVAGLPGGVLHSYERVADGWLEGSPLQGWGYDGEGIVRTPEGRIGFWTRHGFRTAFMASVRYRPSGGVTTYRLDSGAFQTQWGRLFLEACIPAGTKVSIRTATSDDPGDDEPGIPWTRPGNLSIEPYRASLTPPMLPTRLLPGPEDQISGVVRRDTGREIPWSRPEADDPFETYEATVLAEPGRYLWVTLALSGDTRSTPRVKSLRVERPGHDHLRRLPRAYSRDAAMASFLQRYLAMFDGTLADLEARSVDRGILIDPAGTPEELLPWLAAFVGLTVDLRWPVAARRQLLAEIVWLFRFRGTIPGLKRFLEIYLGVPVIIVEKWRFRGLGGTLLGSDAAAVTGSATVVSGGFRIGGALPGPADGTDGGGATVGGGAADAFRTHAHRFSVLVPSVLDDQQLDVVDTILAVHRPAHTIVDVCTIGAGMRVGHGLHLELSSMIGRTGGFSMLQLGGSVLGAGTVVGRPETGTRPGLSALGDGTRVG